jgi:hypothetical protein
MSSTEIPSTDMSSTEFQDVQYRVPRCPDTYFVYWRCPGPSTEMSRYRDVVGCIMVGLSLSSVSKHNMWSYYDWVHCFLFIFSLFWPLLQIIWYPRCMKVRHSNDSSIICSGVTNYAMCVRVSNWGRPSVNKICGRVMIGLSMLSFVSKHNMWLHYDCVVVVVVRQ